MSLTRDDVYRIAHLARIEINETQAIATLAQLNDIFAMIEKMQRLVHEKAIYAPIWQLGFLNGVGPRVGESGFDRIPGFAYTAPFEDLTIKS